MKRDDIIEVEVLCRNLIADCVKAKKFVEEGRMYIGPNPEVAALKRHSMDLTRALARLRGRGRF